MNLSDSRCDAILSYLNNYTTIMTQKTTFTFDFSFINFSCQIQRPEIQRSDFFTEKELSNPEMVCIFEGNDGTHQRIIHA